MESPNFTFNVKHMQYFKNKDDNIHKSEALKLNLLKNCLNPGYFLRTYLRF